jgi:hypothetical protein
MLDPLVVQRRDTCHHRPFAKQLSIAKDAEFTIGCGVRQQLRAQLRANARRFSRGDDETRSISS